MTNTELKILEKLDKIMDEMILIQKKYYNSFLKNQEYEKLMKLVIQNIHPENPVRLNIKTKFQEIKEM